jgi:hypothetical protein
VKRNIARFFLLLSLVIGFSVLNAQEAVLSSGGDATGYDGMVTYSIGQITYLTLTGTNGTIAEGIQQPFEILIPIGIDNDKGITLECLLFPNPANRFVRLKIENHELKDLKCRLYSSTGALVQEVKIETKESLIPMEGLEKASYFLVITQNEKTLKTFQVIKK